MCSMILNESCVFLEDFHVINGVLRTAHSLFKRYRFEFKSNELWTEIKLVLDHFARPLTELFVVSPRVPFPDLGCVVISNYCFNFQQLFFNFGYRRS